MAISGHAEGGARESAFPLKADIRRVGAQLNDSQCRMPEVPTSYASVLEHAVEKRSQLVDPLAYRLGLLDEIRRRLCRQQAARVWTREVG